MELVSVLIPVWNAAPWVGEAIESSFGQTYPSVEVVVVDDGSTDGTADVLQGYAGRLRQERIPHSGAPAARNRLLALARGHWVQYLDADDLLLPRKLESQLAAAGTVDGADLVVSPFLTESGKPRGVHDDSDPWLCLLRGRFGTTTSHLFRRHALIDVGGWDPQRRAAQEQELLGRLLAVKARVVFADEPLSIKRHVNRDSLWRSLWRDDPKAAREADVSAVAGWVRHLRATGELNERRRAAAGARFLRMARSVRQGGAGEGDAVLAEAEAIGLSTDALLSESSLVYRMVYRRRGFEAAERVDHAAREARRRSRRWAAASRRRATRWPRRARAAAGRLLSSPEAGPQVEEQRRDDSPRSDGG